MNTPTKWVSLFSRSGSEIVSLARALNRYPDILITNKQEEDVKKELREHCKLLYLPKNPTLLDYEKLFPELYDALQLSNHKEETLITLHGYLRILPESFIAQFNHIYNGHPGLITEYPELKGKDPQEKAFKMRLKRSGSVIHKVIPEVDAGEVLASQETSLVDKTLDQVYEELALCSLSLWTHFIRDTFPIIGSINNFAKN